MLRIFDVFTVSELCTSAFISGSKKNFFGLTDELLSSVCHSTLQYFLKSKLRITLICNKTGDFNYIDKRSRYNVTSKDDDRWNMEACPNLNLACP